MFQYFIGKYILLQLSSKITQWTISLEEDFCGWHCSAVIGGVRKWGHQGSSPLAPEMRIITTFHQNSFFSTNTQHPALRHG